MFVFVEAQLLGSHYTVQLSWCCSSRLPSIRSRLLSCHSVCTWVCLLAAKVTGPAVLFGVCQYLAGQQESGNSWSLWPTFVGHTQHKEWTMAIGRRTSSGINHRLYCVCAFNCWPPHPGWRYHFQDVPVSLNEWFQLLNYWDVYVLFYAGILLT